MSKKPRLGAATCSARIRFSRRLDTDDICSAWYRGHMIDCTAHWRMPNTWLCLVRHKSGELVAEHTYEGSDRREMLEEAVRIAGLLPNRQAEGRGSDDSATAEKEGQS